MKERNAKITVKKIIKKQLKYLKKVLIRNKQKIL